MRVTPIDNPKTSCNAPKDTLLYVWTTGGGLGGAGWDDYFFDKRSEACEFDLNSIFPKC